MIESTLI